MRGTSYPLNEYDKKTAEELASLNVVYFRDDWSNLVWDVVVVNP